MNVNLTGFTRLESNDLPQRMRSNRQERQEILTERCE